MNNIENNDHVHPIFRNLFEGFAKTFADGKMVFDSVTDMYRWLHDKPGYTGTLQVVFPADFNLNGVSHRMIEFQVTDYDASVAGTVNRLNEHPVPYNY